MSQNPIERSYKHITTKDLKQIPSCAHLSDHEAEEMVLQLRQLSAILCDCCFTGQRQDTGQESEP